MVIELKELEMALPPPSPTNGPGDIPTGLIIKVIIELLTKATLGAWKYRSQRIPHTGV
jgi:hypothetical protein